MSLPPLPSTENPYSTLSMETESVKTFMVDHGLKDFNERNHWGKRVSSLFFNGGPVLLKEELSEEEKTHAVMSLRSVLTSFAFSHEDKTHVAASILALIEVAPTGNCN